MTLIDEGALSQWALFWRRFARRPLALAALCVLAFLYLSSFVVEVLAPYPPDQRHIQYAYAPPQALRWSWDAGLHVRPLLARTDPLTFRKRFEEVPAAVPVRFWIAAAPVRLLGVIPVERRLLGVAPGARQASMFLMGADRYGRDIFSRCLYGARVSLSVGLAGLVLTLLIGVAVGALSGYAGGAVDDLLQRVIDILQSVPQLPLWIALAAVLPSDWSALTLYFAVTILLALLNWTWLARVVRGKILALREEDYAVAARLLGASHARIVWRHLMPNLSSHIIVAVTLSVPGMILGETALSFLGLGLRPPIVSWGVMLQDCIDLKALSFYPWLLMPAGFIVSVVLCFNFIGDGLRDAADPYDN